MSAHPLTVRLRAGRPQRVVFYGTSLTEHGGWVPQLLVALEQHFPGLVSAVNGAGSGMHSGWGLENLEPRVLARAPDAVFLEFSVNDATERFAISLEQSRRNLDEMIDRIQAARPGCEIILQVMNPVLDRPPGHDGHRPRLSDYQDIYRGTARRRGLLLIDHMPAWLDLLHRDEAAFRAYVPDGLHPEGAGYAALVTPTILRALELGRSA